MSSLEKLINQEIKVLIKNVEKDMEYVAEKIGKEAVQELKKTSPKKSGRYAKGWRMKLHNGTLVVFNYTHPWLTHLLENGHETFWKGKRVKRAKAIPHIKPINDKVQEEYLKELKERIESHE